MFLLYFEYTNKRIQLSFKQSVSYLATQKTIVVCRGCFQKITICFLVMVFSLSLSSLGSLFSFVIQLLITTDSQTPVYFRLLDTLYSCLSRGVRVEETTF